MDLPFRFLFIFAVVLLQLSCFTHCEEQLTGFYKSRSLHSFNSNEVLPKIPITDESKERLSKLLVNSVLPEYLPNEIDFRHFRDEFSFSSNLSSDCADHLTLFLMELNQISQSPSYAFNETAAWVVQSNLSRFKVTSKIITM